MSRRRVRGGGRMPEHWEWTCDYCGKRATSNSQATRPPGWVPKGRTIGSAHDFCSAEHEAAYKADQAGQKSENAPETSEAGGEKAEPAAG